MAKQIEIFINDQLVDVPQGGIRFDTTFSIADISVIDQRNSSITKTLTLPGTARNRRIFGFADDLNSTTGIDQTVKPDAKIDVDGVTVLKGAFKITDIVMNDFNNVAEYKGVIIGDNGSWKLLINDLKLSDLDLSDQNHIYDVADIDASETLIDSRDYVYPLINYGAWRGSDSVQVEDRFPAVRVKRLMTQIFEDQGFRMSSSLFDSDFGKRLFLPFTNKTTQADPDFALDKIFRVAKNTPGVDKRCDITHSTDLTYIFTTSNSFIQNVTPLEFDTVISDPDSRWSTITNRYTTNVNGIATFEVTVPLTIVQSSPGSTIKTNIIIQQFDQAGNLIREKKLRDNTNDHVGHTLGGDPAPKTFTDSVQGRFFMSVFDYVIVRYEYRAITAGTFEFDIDKERIFKCLEFDTAQETFTSNSGNVGGQIDFDNETTNGNFDTNNIFDIVFNRYQPTQRSKQNIIYQSEIVTSGGSTEFAIRRRRSGEFQFSDFQTIQISPSDSGTGNSLITQVRIESGYIDVEPGDEFDIFAEITGNDFNGVSNASVTIFKSVLYNDISLELARGAEVILSNQLPDMYQLEFLQAIKTVFNLYFDTDVDTRTVTIETFNDFYTTETVDWSRKLDMMSSRSVQYIGANLSKNIIYDFKEDGKDAPVKQILDRDDSFAEHNATSTNVFARDGETRVTTIFAPTLMATATTIGFTASFLPKMWKDLPTNELPDKSTDFQPRILFYDGVQSNATDESWIWEGTTRTDFPRMYFYDEVNDNDNNLMFKTLRRSHGLFEKYYRNSQKLLNEGRIFVGSFKLNDIDIANLDFRKRIKLILNGEEKIFLLNKVSEYNGEGLTKVELITDVGSQQLSQVTTTADDPNILPPQFQPTPDAVSTGIIATVGGIVVPVYSTGQSGGFFWVQSTITQQGINGG